MKNKPPQADSSISVDLQQSSSSFQHAFQKECIDGSAIAPSLYNAAVEIVEDNGLWEPNRDLNQRVATQWQTRKPHKYGAIAFFKQESGEYWQGKPENPRTDRDGKIIKYEKPLGSGADAYLPPIPADIRVQLRAPLEGSFWQWLESRTDIPIVITEGGKKQLSVLSAGHVAIALVGVNAGVLKYDRISGEKIRKLKPELVPGLSQLAVPGRKFILAFDEDLKPKTRAKVAAARADLAFWLTAAGCEVAIAHWNPSEGKGVDDLIVNQGIGRWNQVLATAQLWQECRVERAIARRLTRKPDLHIGEDEFVDHADRLPKTGLLALLGAKATGKGKLIAKLLKHRRWLSVTTLRSLARDQAAGWGGVFVNQGDRHGDTLLKDGEPCNGGVVCVPSLLKTKGIKADVLVLDELPAILEFILSSKLANKNGIRPLLLEELEHRIRTAKLVICASADLSEAVLRWIEDIRGERAFLVQSERKPLAYPVNLIDGSKNQAIAQFTNRVQSLDAGQVTIFHTDEKALAHSISGDLLNQGIQSLVITGDTSGGETESAFLASKGADIPALAMAGIKAIITSPSVKEGFSIEHHTDRIDSVWGVFTGCSITPESVAQTCDRVRSLIPRYLWIAERGRAYSKLSRAESTAAFLRDFKRSSNALVSVTRRSLLTETELRVKDIDWESPSMKLLAHIEVERNRGMKTFRARVIALLKAEGKLVTSTLSAITPEQEKAICKALKAIRSKRDVEHAIAIESRSLISEEHVNELEKKDSLTPNERLDLERFYLEQFYHTKITREDVLWDKNSDRRTKIRNLEAVLNPDKAEAISAASINQNAATPQDWKRTKLRQWIVEECGAAELIRCIVAGEVQELTPERTDPIGQWLKQHGKDVAIAFNFSNIASVSDRQAAFLILDWVGMTRTSMRHRCNGKVLRRYFVDSDNLEKLKTAMEKRMEADPPLQVLDLNQGDGSQNFCPQKISNLARSCPMAIDDKSRRETLSDSSATKGVAQ